MRLFIIYLRLYKHAYKYYISECAIRKVLHGKELTLPSSYHEPI